MYKKKLIFFADEFKSSFILTEIEQLRNNFKELIIVTTNPNYVSNYDSIKVVYIDMERYSMRSVLKNNYLLLFKIIISELIEYPKYVFALQEYKRRISSLLRCSYRANEIECNLLKKEELNNLTFFSFWLNDWATTLALLKNKKPELKFFSRVHGTDLYEDRLPLIKKIPFRKLQLKEINKVFSVSKAGAAYLQKKYPQYKNKVDSLYLGTLFSGENLIRDQEEFTLISCATIRDIKRIHLIPEILQHINFKINWIHIGGENHNDPSIGTLNEALEKLKIKSNVTVKFLGELTNKQVSEFYQSQQVNLFISVSETEGLPVSMMEAIAYGIPILATDVGGCKEIVNEETGVLIEKDFKINDAVLKIENFKNSLINKQTSRKKIISFWEDHFNASKNMNELCLKIMS